LKKVALSSELTGAVGLLGNVSEWVGHMYTNTLGMAAVAILPCLDSSVRFRQASQLETGSS
jgi:hypothetical protein